MSVIWINNLKIDAIDEKVTEVVKDGKTLLQLEIQFKVTHGTYHDVTTELYKNDFVVKVPEQDITLQAVIQNYYTSVTNLYEEGEVGDFNLTLVEKG